MFFEVPIQWRRLCFCSMSHYVVPVRADCFIPMWQRPYEFSSHGRAWEYPWSESSSLCHVKVTVLSSAEHHNTALLFEPKLFFTQKRKKSVFQPNKSCFSIPLITACTVMIATTRLNGNMTQYRNNCMTLTFYFNHVTSWQSVTKPRKNKMWFILKVNVCSGFHSRPVLHCYV